VLPLQRNFDGPAVAKIDCHAFVRFASIAGMRTILLVILILILIGSLPTWGYSSGWGTGYYPAGGLVILIVLILVLMKA